uniref:T-complex protein 11-like protein 1 n=2 Tax=Arion vulgaris TaxID=1028688 RepID=A0A0B7ASM7_9EUPU
MSKENKSNDKPSESSDEHGQDTLPQLPGIPDELLNMVGASPPRFVTFEQLMSAADNMKNITLAHEIAVNDEFELQKVEPPPNSWRKNVADTVKRAFWDVFKEKISADPPDLSFAYAMLEELRETLLEILLPQHQRLKDQINEVLDLALIKQKMENDAFEFDYYAKYITDTMARLCAPARDENIEEIRAINDVVSKFRAIMETLELMRRDMANFTIKQIRPYIQQNSIEYERKKFSEYFDTQRAVGVNALEYTEVWLKRNYEKMLKRSSDSLEPSGSSSTKALTPANVMTEAYLEVFVWPDPDHFPETLMMDMFRFMAMRDKLHTLGLITSIQLLTFSIVGPSIECADGLKKQLKEHVEILLQDVGTKGIKPVLESITDQVIKDVNDSLSSSTLPLLTDATKQTLRSQIMNLGSRENTVRKLMHSRLMGFIQEGMTGKNVNSLPLPKGCSAIQRELSQVMGSFLRLSSHNRSVFGQQYSEIIEKLMQHSSSGASASGSSLGATA